MALLFDDCSVGSFTTFPPTREREVPHMVTPARFSCVGYSENVASFAPTQFAALLDGCISCEVILNE
jgi:hypothetical protein